MTLNGWRQPKGGQWRLVEPQHFRTGVPAPLDVERVKRYVLAGLVATLATLCFHSLGWLPFLALPVLGLTDQQFFDAWWDQAEPSLMPAASATYNAGWFGGPGDSRETIINAAIAVAAAAAVAAGIITRVWLTASMYGYDPNLVAFNTNVQMVREGGAEATLVDVIAYGAMGNGARDDATAFQGAVAFAFARTATFGTSGLGTPIVVVPAPSAHYLIKSSIALPPGIEVRGLGTGPMLRFIPTVTSSNLFTFYGTVENQGANIILRNMSLYQNKAASASIAFRIRNFGQIYCYNVGFSNFRVGAWADWGTGFYAYQCSFNLCVRGVQMGGNLSQAETPVPPAGIRNGVPASTSPAIDTVVLEGCSFAQNQVDINHMGSTYAHGQCSVTDCSFYESATTPVAAKFRFISTTNLKNLNVRGCWFECGSVAGGGRTGIFQGAFDYDGNAAAVNLGGEICGNHFLFTGAAASTRGVDISAGNPYIHGNVFEFAAACQPLTLTDNSRAQNVGKNTFLTWPDVGSYTQPITIVAPTVPHRIWQEEVMTGDRGDNNLTLTLLDDQTINTYVNQRWATNLTANRTVTLPVARFWNGARYRIIRTGLGAFTLDVGPGVKVIPNSTAAVVEVMCDGTAWRLINYSLL